MTVTTTRVARAVLRCAAITFAMLARRRLALPRPLVGSTLRFGDGRTSRIFRETAVREPAPDDPAVLVVHFALRWIGHVRWPHAVFRRTCVVNTPLFAGFPGFHSKLWLADTGPGGYRGVYEWHGAGPAADYARVLSRVLALVSVPGSIRWHVVPGLRRDSFLHRSDGSGEWWTITGFDAAK